MAESGPIRWYYKFANSCTVDYPFVASSSTFLFIELEFLFGECFLSGGHHSKKKSCDVQGKSRPYVCTRLCSWHDQGAESYACRGGSPSLRSFLCPSSGWAPAASCLLRTTLHLDAVTAVSGSRPKISLRPLPMEIHRELWSCKHHNTFITYISCWRIKNRASSLF